MTQRNPEQRTATILSKRPTTTIRLYRDTAAEVKRLTVEHNLRLASENKRERLTLQDFIDEVLSAAKVYWHAQPLGEIPDWRTFRTKRK